MRHPVSDHGSLTRPRRRLTLASLRDARLGRRLVTLLLPIAVLLLLASNSTPAAGSGSLDLQDERRARPPQSAADSGGQDLPGVGEALAALDAETLANGLSGLMVALEPTPTATAEPTPTPEPTAAQPPPQQPRAPAPQIEPRLWATQVPAPTPTDPPPPAPSSSCPSATMSGFELDVFHAINRERTQRGLAQLAADGCGVHIAQRRSSDMAGRRYFSHTSPDGETMSVLLSRYGVPFDHAGEDLARNNYPNDQTVAVAVRNLMESDGHRAIVLDGSYTHLGVGFADDGAGMKYYALVFLAF